MGGGPQAVGTRAATRGFGCSSGAPCGGRGQSGRAVRCRAPSGTTRTSPRPPSKPSTRASTRPTPSTRRWNRSPPSQQTARRPSCIGSRPSPSAAAAATPGRALGRPQTEEAGCGWSELRAELRAELRSARLAPRPRNHRILGAVRLGRVGGVHHVTVGDLVDHDRDRAGARRQVRRDDQVLVRRVVEDARDSPKSSGPVMLPQSRTPFEVGSLQPRRRGESSPRRRRRESLAFTGRASGLRPRPGGSKGCRLARTRAKRPAIAATSR